MDQARARRLLGVSAAATRTDIEAAFRSRVMATHPDRGGQADEFRSVVEARRALLHAAAPRRPPAVTVIPDGKLVRQLLIAVLRRVLDRQDPNRRVI
ncbi:MAG: J domain-containing protein [Actinomycetota bacterium]|nr:J domain-containing protein [Actinomycetota bacterium]